MSNNSKSKTRFYPCCLATAVGGMPHQDIDAANKFILDSMIEIPHIPMLPKATVNSGSTVRFLEGMPCLIRTKGGTQCYIETSDGEFTHRELKVFYEKFLREDSAYFEMTREYAPDIHGMLDYLKAYNPKGWVMFNCGVRGPVTLGMQVMDEEGKPIFYNEIFRDALIKTLYMKIKWMEKRVTEALPGLRLLIMIAEPGLSVQGSPLYTLEKNLIVNSINEVLSATNNLTMIHCCGNIDWSILMDSNVSIINFDAYNHSDRFILYYKHFIKYLERGRMIAWGVVPTTEEDFKKETVCSLQSRFENAIQTLVDQGIDRHLLLSSSLITPSCSTAGLRVEIAEEVYRITQSVARALRSKYFHLSAES